MSETRLPGPFGFGDILDAAFGLYRRNFLTLFATALVLLAPLFVIGWLAFPRMNAMAAADPANAVPIGSGFLVFLLAMLVAIMLLWGGLTRLTSQALIASPVTFTDGLAKGFRSLLRLTGAVILSIIAIYAGMVVIMLVLMLPAMLITNFAGAGQQVASVIMGIIMVVGGIAATLFWIAGFFALAPAVVVEGLGPWSAIKRSWGLSKGGRLRIIGILVVTYLITMLPTIAVAVGTSVIGALSATAFVLPGPGEIAAVQVINLAVGALTLPFLVAVVVALYYDRRARKEGADLLEPAGDEFAPAY